MDGGGRREGARLPKYRQKKSEKVLMAEHLPAYSKVEEGGAGRDAGDAEDEEERIPNAECSMPNEGRGTVPEKAPISAL